MEIKYTPKTKEELRILCADLSVNLGEIDTSKITDMGGLFYLQTERTDFSGIENWDVSKVEDTEDMFKNSPLEKLVKTMQWDWSKYHEQRSL